MEVEVIKATNPFEGSAAVDRNHRLRVAAYARVSTNDEDQIKSYDSMVTYYTDMIKKNPDWDFVEVYADKASTGTKAETRENFQRLIADCLAGKIDLVIAKSLSRFARNTLDTLKYVRQLRERHIAVYFEVEKINTMKDGEFLLTILSSVAQQEVENTSAYVKKGLKMKMKRGEMVGFHGCLGYDYDYKTKTLSINEKGAEVVRLMFERYVSGVGSTMIANELNRKGIPTLKGNPWTTSSVMGVINNEKYTGDILLGKTFTVDPISKRRLENLGEEDRFFIKDHHPPIISREIFEKAQEIRNKRNGGRKHKVLIGKREKYSRQFAFSSMLKCGFCGTSLTRRCWHSNSKYRKVIWQCHKFVKDGKRSCPDSKGIPEQVIEEAFVESYRQLTTNNKQVMNEFLRRMEAEVIDGTNQKYFDKAIKDENQYKEKRRKLVEKYIDGEIDKEIYESTDREYKIKLSETRAQIDYYDNQLQDQENLRRRVEEFKKALSENKVLEEFDRGVFESIVEKVIIGGIDDDGKKDPYRITFIYKNGFNDTIGFYRPKPKPGPMPGPKDKNEDKSVYSKNSSQSEDTYSNSSDNTCGDRGLDVKSERVRKPQMRSCRRPIQSAFWTRSVFRITGLSRNTMWKEAMKQSLIKIHF